MKAAIAPTMFLAAFVASANIRPPPCVDCRVQPAHRVGPGKLEDFGDEQKDIRPRAPTPSVKGATIITVPARFIAGAVNGAANAGK